MEDIFVDRRTAKGNEPAEIEAADVEMAIEALAQEWEVDRSTKKMTVEGGDSPDGEDSSDEDFSSEGEGKEGREGETEEDDDPDSMDASENRQGAQVDKESKSDFPEVVSHPLLHTTFQKFFFWLISREAKLEIFAKLVGKYEWANVDKWMVIPSQGFLKELIANKIKETKITSNSSDDNDGDDKGDNKEGNEEGDREVGGDDGANGGDNDDDDNKLPLSKSIFAKAAMEEQSEGAIREEENDDEMIKGVAFNIREVFMVAMEA